jgi:hypothetical protein
LKESILEVQTLARPTPSEKNWIVQVTMSSIWSLVPNVVANMLENQQPTSNGDIATTRLRLETREGVWGTTLAATTAVVTKV